MMKVQAYFKQEIQTNNLLWPNRFVEIYHSKYWHLYTCKRIYLVWWLCLIIEKMCDAAFLLRVSVGLKLMVEKVFDFLTLLLIGGEWLNIFTLLNTVSLRIHWRLIFGNVIRYSALWLWIGYFIYFTFTPVLF